MQIKLIESDKDAIAKRKTSPSTFNPHHDGFIDIGVSVFDLYGIKFTHKSMVFFNVMDSVLDAIPGGILFVFKNTRRVCP
jgi:hypothetical protein